MNKKTVKDIDLKGKRVFMRVDFNVPMADGKVTDDKRIRAALPTIQYVLEQGASLMLASHLGRPKGVRNPEFSLKAASEALSALIDKPVQMAPDCVGPEVEALVQALLPGDVLMLENTRFHAGEEKTTSTLPNKWPPWRMSTSMTLLARPIALMPPPRASPASCRLSPAS
jgi:phosphoglycerate kinase